MGKFDVRSTVGIDFKVNRVELDELKKELAALKSLKAEDILQLNKGLNLTEAKKQLSEIRNHSTEVQQALTNAFNTDLGVMNISKLSKELRKLPIADIYQSFKMAGAAGTAAFNSISSAVLKGNLQLKESHALLDKMATTMANTVRFSISSSVFNNLLNGIQKSWDFTKQLDTSLNDIRIVTGKSADEMERFARTANKAAKNLGATTQDYTKASLIYYQQGLDDAQVEARTNVTVKAANVTGQQASEVSEQLTAIWNGYKVDAAEAELYIDKVAKVAATTAADLEEMATGMSRVASAANNAGVDIDQLNAMLATVISVTREAPETVGTSFRTIFARLGDLKIGGSDEDGVGLGKVSGQLQALGVQVLDESGNMRKMGKIIEDVAKKWQTWTEAQRQAVAVAMAGKMQYSRFIALFDNWDMYTQAINDSRSATGELQKQQDTYMESTAAHLDKLTAAQERVSNAFIDNGKINGSLDAITGLTVGVANFIEALGGGDKALLAFGGIATQILNKQIASGINSIINNMQIAKQNAVALEQQLNALQWMQSNIGGPNKDLGLDAKVQYRAEMQKYAANLSPTAIEQGNGLIDDLGNAISKQQQYNQDLTMTLNLLSQITGMDIKSIYAISDKNVISYLDEPEAQEKFYNYVAEWETFDTDIKAVVDALDLYRQAQLKANEQGQESKKTINDQVQALSSFMKNLDDIVMDKSWLIDSDLMKGMSDTTKTQLKADIQEFKKILRQQGEAKNGDGPLDLLLGSDAKWTNEFTGRLKRLQQFIDQAKAELKRGQEIIDIEDKTRGQQSNFNQKDIDNKKSNLNEFFSNEQRQELIQDIVKISGAVTSLISSLQTLVNIPTIWNNENLSTMEKFVQTLMSIGTALPMIITGTNNIITSFKSVGKLIDVLRVNIAKENVQLKIKNQLLKEGYSQEVAATIAEQQFALMTNFSTKATWGEVAALAAKKALMIGGILLAIGLVAGATYTLVKAYNADADAAREAAEAAEKTKEAYNAAAEANQKLQDTLKGYQDGLKNIQNLTKGTNEYKQAVLEANEKVIDLLDTYKELNKYISRDDNGLLIITDEGMDQIQKLALQRQQQTQLDYLNAESKAINKQTISNITNWTRGTNVGWNTTYGQYNQIGAYGDSSEIQQKYQILDTGNINLQARPIYRQDNGDISTLRSGSFWSEKEQKEILVPAIYELTEDIKEIVGDNITTARNGVIDIFNEFDGDEAYKKLQEIYEKNGQFLGKFEHAVDAGIYAQAIHEANEYQYTNTGNRSLSGDHITSDIVNAVANYMDKMNIEEFTLTDMLNVDEISEASSEMQLAIKNNIKPLSEFAKEINNAKAVEKTYTEQATDAYLKMKGIVDDDGKMTVEEIITERIMNNEGGTVVTTEESLKPFQYGLNWGANLTDANKVGYSQTDILAAVEMYEKTYNNKKINYNNDTDVFSGKTLIGTPKDKSQFGREGNYKLKTQSKNNEGIWAEDNDLTVEQLMTWYGEQKVLDDRGQGAKNKATTKASTITALANSIGFSDTESLQTIFSNSYAGENGKIQINKDNTLLSQDKAKELSEKITGIDKNALATALGYTEEQVDKFYTQLEEWINKRKEMSDTDVWKNLGAQGSKNSRQVRDDMLSGSLTSDNADNNEAYQNLLGEAQTLLKIYPQLSGEVEILNNKALIGSEIWAESLYKVRDAFGTLKLSKMIDNVDNLSKHINNFIKDGKLDFDATININGQDTDFQNLISSILNQNYEIDVEVHAQAEEAFETFESSLKNMEKVASQIGDDYIVQADNLRELETTFPHIADGYKILADGRIQLKDTQVAMAMAGAQAEIEESNKTTVEILENQLTTLESKQVHYKQAYEAAQALAKGEGNEAENTTALKKAFDEIESQNNEAKAKAEMSNAQAVANDSNTNAKITTDNWSKSAEVIKNKFTATIKTILAGFQAIKNGDSDFQQFTSNAEYTGLNGKSQEETTLAELREAAEAAQGDDRKEKYQQIANELASIIKTNERSMADIRGMIIQTKAQTYDFTNKAGNIAKGLGSDGKKSGSTSKPSEEKPLDKETDPYHDVNIQLSLTEAKLKQVQSQNDKAFGAKKIENYNQQLGLLNNKLDLTKEKMKIAQKEQQRLGGLLAARGAKFNDDGTIANYAQLYEQQLAKVNAVIAKYNGMTKEQQEAYKDTLDAAKEDFSKFEEQLKDYDDNVSSLIPGLLQDIQDFTDEQIEIQIKKFNMEFEIRFDMGEAEKDWNEFKKKIIDGIKDDDIIGNARARATDDLSVYLDKNGNGLLSAGTKQTNEVLEQLYQMDKTGWSDVYGDDRTSALEDLQEAYQNVEESMLEIQQIQDDVHQAWLDTMDDVNDKMQDQVDMYDQITNLIDHDVKVIELVYGATDFDAIGRYYQKQYENNLSLLDFQRQQATFWENEMNSIVDKNSEEWKKARDNWISAVNDLNATIETTIEKTRDKLENMLDGILDKFNKQITNGMGLDYASQQWKLVNENASQYLDTVNAAFGIRQLEKKYQDAIDKTDNLGAQRKLNKIMQEELEALKEKDKLSEYDVERANKRYEIALKQIALEEAQNAKNSMRLRRDSQGNYRYEYVADEDQVAKLRDEIDVLQNSLYNFDKERWTSVQDEIVEAVRARNEAIKEIEMDASLDEEERLARLEEINQLYNEKIQNITDLAMTAQINLYDSGAEEIRKIWAKALEEELQGRELNVETFLELYNKGILDEIAMREFGSTQLAEILKNQFMESIDFTKISTEDMVNIIKEGIIDHIEFSRLSEEELTKLVDTGFFDRIQIKELEKDQILKLVEEQAIKSVDFSQMSEDKITQLAEQGFFDRVNFSKMETAQIRELVESGAVDKIAFSKMSESEITQAVKEGTLDRVKISDLAEQDIFKLVNDGTIDRYKLSELNQQELTKLVDQGYIDRVKFSNLEEEQIYEAVENGLGQRVTLNELSQDTINDIVESGMATEEEIRMNGQQTIADFLAGTLDFEHGKYKDVTSAITKLVHDGALDNISSTKFETEEIVKAITQGANDEFGIRQIGEQQLTALLSKGALDRYNITELGTEKIVKMAQDGVFDEVSVNQIGIETITGFLKQGYADQNDIVQTNTAAMVEAVKNGALNNVSTTAWETEQLVDAISKGSLDTLTLKSIEKDKIVKLAQQGVLDEIDAKRFGNEEIDKLVDSGIASQVLSNQLGMADLEQIWKEGLGTELGLHTATSEDIQKLFGIQDNAFKDLSKEEKRVLLEEMLPQFNTGVNTMIDKFSGEGGFEQQTLSSMAAIKDANDTYQQDLEEIQRTADQSFDDIEKGLDKNIPKTEKLTEDNRDLIKSMEDELQAIKDINEQLEKQIAYYSALSQAAQAAATEAYNYWLKEQQIAAEKAAAEKKNTEAPKAQNPASTQQTQTKTNTDTKVVEKANNDTKNADKMEGVAATIWIWGGPQSGWYNGDDRSSRLVEKFGKKGATEVQNIINTKAQYGKLNDKYNWNDLKRNYYYGKFDTGGYTGEWAGGYGKLALLHSKELVLNAKDTENMLSMVDIARQVLTNVGAGTNIISSTAKNGAAAGSAGLEQNVNIQANFPDVSDAAEIKAALDSLVNLAAQRAQRKVR